MAKNFKHSVESQLKKVDTGVQDGVFVYTGAMTLGEVCKALNINATEVIKKYFMQGKMFTLNTEISEDMIGELCLENGFDFKKEVEVTKENLLENFEIIDDAKDLVERPPVITIMGHVDHGKTTLLDTIRKSKVTAGEFGGITQHIGAYQIEKDGKKLTFLDTPGHEAFTAMRARGAAVTDIVIIVVAADDSVMPQTIEAIDHAKAAGVPIIVAMNKMDKPHANPEKVMAEVSDHGLTPEEWGGDTIFKPISALTGDGIEDLLETILLIAEVQEFKANPKRHAVGTVIESHLDKGRGTVATVLIQTGTLKIGDPVVAGTSFGRIRSMCDDMGKAMTTAGPSTPVEITGLDSIPNAGDKFMAFENDKMAREVAQTRNDLKVEQSRNHSRGKTLEELSQEIALGDLKELNIIVKCDVQGTVEAIKHQIAKIEVEGARVNLIRASVGAISDSDVLLATASSAIIYGFNVKPTAAVKAKADELHIEIRLHNIIYKMQEEIEGILEGKLDKKYEPKVTGHAEIRAIFKFGKTKIAGCMITDGTVKRNAKVKVLRHGKVVFEGELDSLKREKNEAKEVQKGMECGMVVDGFNDIEEFDIIEAFEMVEVK